ncbi:UDP-3-O-(3-hydroxymyristoyl)glucosamine N-acyltransferase [Campylobacter sp. faydin G-24]|uniref:UDP-3-O-acylglucosamine N-acyltransferase n=1 Tax=Campylobacter anatolicus TaxID=2829105 RepID=A0ABS5HI36_9BACT|nr:UDP-3-O-(3-hydroxymyristoyl)glucosamine N-acyltransferase [Campylobacter anatolicus]MBR8462846.1 UDP-3-O-(3-hydroxymyristoyl)glucosamine N-acyltransferase [Campylobacter anatolicus]MBR8463920.1 UDP-3-O-(3-hydroxymyristoyl)glucosamine N-acyltransferase [Campylobacter anatolicus]MBR8465868.1 UDP-3-O-(3-hydroxymyristoyl)glucosamine N-acyltransferase [Campylobacter anatolicus]
MKLSEIAQKTGASFSGEDIEIFAINSLKNANKAELTYCDGEKNAKFIKDSNAGAILVSQNLLEFVPETMSAVVCENPHLAFAILSKDYAKPIFCEQKPSNIASSATIMPNVYIGSNVSVGENTIVMAGAYLGDNVKIGKNCIIHPNVVIYNDCIVGDECHLLANCVIGSDGFGYAHTKTGEHVKIYHNGNVVLGDFVEIGACTTIDRGVFESTKIANFTKIDNLVQVGHNCELGQGCLIVSQTGLAGSSVLGRNVVMGGQSGTAGHLRIGDFAQIAARGGVSKDIDGGKKYAGYPLQELGEFFKFQAKIARFFKKN